MEKDDANEILVNAMGVLFSESEMEVSIAEANGISRNKYNEIIEKGLQLPECIRKYREINRKKRLYEEKLIKHELKEKGEIAEFMYKPALLDVFSNYPRFRQEYEILKANEYLIETENGLKWRKTKQSLAEYFGNLPLSRETKKNNVPWKAIEILFGVKDLKNSFSNNGNAHGKTQSKDYKKLLEILSTPISK
jgi:hypothetical protein